MVNESTATSAYTTFTLPSSFTNSPLIGQYVPPGGALWDKVAIKTQFYERKASRFLASAPTSKEIGNYYSQFLQQKQKNVNKQIITDFSKNSPKN